MKAWLISNAFLTTTKYSEINIWLVESAKRQGIDLEIKTNAELMVQTGYKDKAVVELPDFVLFWDKDIRLAQSLEFKGLNLYNSAKAIEICDDKSYTHLVLEQYGIPMPKTFFAPKTFEAVGYSNKEFLTIVEEQLDFPMVLKECFGSFGQQVYLVHNHQELEKQIMKLAGKPLLFQEFIKSSFARDVRLQVVGNQVVASMFRYSETGDFRANISNGGKMKPYEPSEEAINLAVKCCELIGLDFAGVDMLFDENENPIVCEVNSNAHFKNIYDCTGVNVADCIMEYILEQMS